MEVFRKSRVLIVDDHPIVRVGYTHLIEDNERLTVAGAIASGEELLAYLAAELQPDVVIVDICLPGMNGIVLISEILVRYPNIRVLVCSAFEEELFGERCLRTGARGYVNKTEAPLVLVQALHAVARGDIYVSETLSQRMLGNAFGSVDHALHPVTSLTPRELDVFERIGQGKTVDSIAQELDISIKTVRKHRGNIKMKLKVTSLPDLQQQAVKWRIENR